MATYVLVSQHNWREERVASSGKTYIAITDKPPPNLDAAPDWPGTKVVEWHDEDPPTEWGHTTYRVLMDGTLVYVANDWDSSG